MPSGPRGCPTHRAFRCCRNGVTDRQFGATRFVERCVLPIDITYVLGGKSRKAMAPRSSVEVT